MILLSFRLIGCLLFETTFESLTTLTMYLTREVNVCNLTKMIWIQCTQKYIKIIGKEWKYDSCWVRKLGVNFVAMR